MRLKLVAITLLSFAVAAPAAAQTLSTGVRVGASVNPDQFYFGGHVETRPLADNITFRPNVEIGVGNDAKVVAFNFELAYTFGSKQPFQVYAFAGPALNVINVNHDTSSHGGFNIGIGIQHRGGLFGEIKAGTIDSPDFKVGIGYRFR